MIRIITCTIFLAFLCAFGGRAQHGMLLAKPAAGGGTTYLLDTYTGAAAAYGMNKLSSTATNCVTILRASDNDTLVVGFSGDDFDSSAATTFVSSGHGYVITCWDQSGNGYHARQTDTTKAGKIIIDGTLSTLNSQPAISFNNGDFLSAATSFTTYTALSFVSVLQMENGTYSNWRISSNNSNYTSLFSQSNVLDLRRVAEGTLTQARLSSFYSGQRLVWGDDSATNRAIYINSITSASNSTSTADNALTKELYINSFNSTGGLSPNSKFQVFIYYLSDQSANRTGIETEINTYYSIY